MATAKNRVISAAKFYLSNALIGTGSAEVALPAMTGSSLNWDGSGTGTGTADSWRELAGVEPDSISISDTEVSFNVNETALTSLGVGLASALAGSGSGYTSAENPTDSSHLPMLSMAMQMKGPNGKWGRVDWFLRVKRTDQAKVQEVWDPLIPQAPVDVDYVEAKSGADDLKKGNVRKLKMTFRILAYNGSTSATTGATVKRFEASA